MRVRFESRRELAPGIWQYYFRPDRPARFEPGQYAELRLVGVKNDPRGRSRTFTLTSLPGEDNVRFVLKHFGQQSPYKHALEQLQPGDEADVGVAMGDLVLPKNSATPLVFVAGGIGIASYASILQYLISRREERPIFLFYYMRSRREQIFRDLTEAYPLQLKQLIYAPNRVRAKEIKDTTPPGALIYLSGSQTFVEDLRTELEVQGTPRELLVFDYYDGYAEL